jgi:hypothetical protein
MREYELQNFELPASNLQFPIAHLRFSIARMLAQAAMPPGER